MGDAFFILIIGVDFPVAQNGFSAFVKQLVGNGLVLMKAARGEGIGPDCVRREKLAQAVTRGI